MCAAEQHQRRLPVLPAGRLEDVGPTRPRCRPARGERNVAISSLLSLDAALAGQARHVLRPALALRSRHVGNLDAAAAEQCQRIDAEHQADDADQDERADAQTAAAHWDRNTAGAPPRRNMPPPPSPRRSSTFSLSRSPSPYRMAGVLEVLQVARRGTPKPCSTAYLAHEALSQTRQQSRRIIPRRSPQVPTCRRPDPRRHAPSAVRRSAAVCGPRACCARPFSGAPCTWREAATVPSLA